MLTNCSKTKKDGNVTDVEGKPSYIEHTVHQRIHPIDLH